MYRKEIDGLRAIAVLPVIFFHAGTSIFSGGYVGVDIFFVISGYLITSILLKEIEAEKFSLVGFYERRARRILPALFLVLLVCIPASIILMLPAQLEQFGINLISISLFFSNITFWLDSGYFATSSELKPLLHTWSLAVEEQFYIFFPIFLFVSIKYFNKFTVPILLIGSIISLLYAQLGGNLNFSAPFIEENIQFFNQPDLASFFLITGRVWELVLGGLCAISLNRDQRLNTPRRGPFIVNFLSILGFLLILFSIFAYDETLIFPSVYTIVPTLGTALIILYASSGSWVARILSHKWLVAVGLVSYSAYLWHQPLLAFTRLAYVGPTPGLSLLLAAAASLVFAFFSWKYVEAPFRQKEKFQSRTIFTMAAIGTVFFILVGAILYKSNGLEYRLSAEQKSVANMQQQYLDYLEEDNCNLVQRSETNSPKCVYSDNKIEAKPSIAIYGDSHAGALSLGMRKNQSLMSKGFVRLTKDACPPIRFLELKSIKRYCPQFNEAVFEFLKKSPNIKTVVLVARWRIYQQFEGFENEYGEKEDAPPFDFYDTSVDNSNSRNAPQRRSDILNAYASGISDLLDMGKNVVIVYQTPENGFDVPLRYLKLHLKGKKNSSLSTSHPHYLMQNAPVNDLFDEIAKHPRVAVVKPDQVLCNTFELGRCVTTLGNKLLYFDDDHLSIEGSTLISNELAKTINGFGQISTTP